MSVHVHLLMHLLWITLEGGLRELYPSNLNCRKTGSYPQHLRPKWDPTSNFSSKSVGRLVPEIVCVGGESERGGEEFTIIIAQFTVLWISARLVVSTAMVVNIIPEQIISLIETGNS